MNDEAWETRGGALRVIPAETRLTVYRRRPVLGRESTSFKMLFFRDVAFFCRRKCKMDLNSDFQKLQVSGIIEPFDVNFLMAIMINENFK